MANGDGKFCQNFHFGLNINIKFHHFQMHLLAIVGRVLILNSMTFIEVLQELNMPSPLETILDIWIQKMPLIGQPDKRKLLSM